MARWILLLVSMVALQAQTHVAVGSRTGVTSEKGTIQHDPTNTTRIQACYIVINPTVAGSMFTSVGGTAATTTAVTPTSVVPGGKAVKALVFQDSNVGSGTTTSAAMTLTANVPNVFSIKSIYLSGSGTTKNFTVNITLNSSGNVTWSLYWAEDGKCED